MSTIATRKTLAQLAALRPIYRRAHRSAHIRRGTPRPRARHSCVGRGEDEPEVQPRSRAARPCAAHAGRHRGCFGSPGGDLKPIQEADMKFGSWLTMTP